MIRGRKKRYGYEAVVTKMLHRWTGNRYKKNLCRGFTMGSSSPVNFGIVWFEEEEIIRDPTALGLTGCRFLSEGVKTLRCF